METVKEEKLTDDEASLSASTAKCTEPPPQGDFVKAVVFFIDNAAS